MTLRTGITRSGRRFRPLDDDVECPICFEDIKSKKIFTATCIHTYHIDCIREWISHNPSCPCCRKKLNIMVFTNKKDTKFMNCYNYAMNIYLKHWLDGDHYRFSKTGSIQLFPIFENKKGILYDFYIKPFIVFGRKCSKISFNTDDGYTFLTTEKAVSEFTKRKHMIILVDWQIEVLQALKGKHSFIPYISYVSIILDFNFILISGLNIPPYTLQCAGAVSLYNVMKLAKKDNIFGKKTFIGFTDNSINEELFDFYDMYLQSWINGNFIKGEKLDEFRSRYF